MKKLVTKNVYKSANCLFNADEVAAWSYAHWQFVRVIQGKVVFNAYRYSNTTAKHQYRVRALMESLGVRIDVVANVRESLTRFSTVGAVNRATKETDRQIAARKATERLERLAAGRIRRLNARGLYSADQNAELRRSVGDGSRSRDWSLSAAVRSEARRAMKGGSQ